MCQLDNQEVLRWNKRSRHKNLIWVGRGPCCTDRSGWRRGAAPSMIPGCLGQRRAARDRPFDQLDELRAVALAEEHARLLAERGAVPLGRRLQRVPAVRLVVVGVVLGDVRQVGPACWRRQPDRRQGAPGAARPSAASQSGGSRATARSARPRRARGRSRSVRDRQRAGCREDDRGEGTPMVGSTSRRTLAGDGGR